MSTSELNLLLRRQNCKDIQDNQVEIQYETFSVTAIPEDVEEEEEVDDLDDEKNSLTLNLSQCQMEQNDLFLQLKCMWEEFCNLKTNLQKVYHYLTCMKVTAKATKDLKDMLIIMANQESEDTNDDINVEETELQVLEILQDDVINDMWEKVASCKKNHDIATKNFKILLEIIDFNREEIVKLKKQYYEVLDNYQHARSELENELHDSLEKVKEIFCKSLNSLGSHVEDFMVCTTNLGGLVKYLIDSSTRTAAIAEE